MLSVVGVPLCSLANGKTPSAGICRKRSYKSCPVCWVGKGHFGRFSGGGALGNRGWAGVAACVGVRRALGLHQVGRGGAVGSSAWGWRQGAPALGVAWPARRQGRGGCAGPSARARVIRPAGRLPGAVPGHASGLRAKAPAICGCLGYQVGRRSGARSGRWGLPVWKALDRRALRVERRRFRSGSSGRSCTRSSGRGLVGGKCSGLAARCPQPGGILTSSQQRSRRALAALSR